MQRDIGDNDNGTTRHGGAMGHEGGAQRDARAAQGRGGGTIK